MTTRQTAPLADRVAERAVAPQQTGPTMADLLERQKDQITRALPKAIDADRFLRVVLTEVRKTPKLAQCTPASFLGAVMTAAQLGLEFGPLGLAYLVPFYNKKQSRLECQLIIGYKGYLALARRSGEVSYIIARAVHAHDRFDWEYGLEERLVHKPELGDRGPIIAYYGVAKFRDGGHLIEVMSPEDVGKRRARSQTGDADFGPWATDEEAMSLKTVVRKMQPWLPLTVETASLVAADEHVVDLRGEDLVIHDEDVIDADTVDETEEPKSETTEATQ